MIEEGRNQPARRPEDSSGGHLLLGWVLIIVGVVLMFAGWLGVSANPSVARQMAYLASGGLGGLLAGIIGVGLLVSDDVRRDRARLGRLEAAVLEMRDLLEAQAEALGTASGREAPGRERTPRG
jgi:hypothetical protein